MAKLEDNATFAGIVQAELIKTGHYRGLRDEWAGPETLKAFRVALPFGGGVAPVIVPPVSIEPGNIDWPDPPAKINLPKETSSAMTAFYGSPSASPDYLAYFSFPHPQTRLYTRSGGLLKDYVGDSRLDHRCHKAVAPRLEAALAEIYLTLGKERFEKEGWHLYGGCHNYRIKVGGSSLSTHAWGIAVDMNPGENPYASTKSTFSDKSIDIMEKWGFLSGFRAWGKDAMHFQAVIPNISSGSYYAKNGLPKNIVAV